MIITININTSVTSSWLASLNSTVLRISIVILKINSCWVSIIYIHYLVKWEVEYITISSKLVKILDEHLNPEDLTGTGSLIQFVHCRYIYCRQKGSNHSISAINIATHSSGTLVANINGTNQARKCSLRSVLGKLRMCKPIGIGWDFIIYMPILNLDGPQKVATFRAPPPQTSCRWVMEVWV